MRKETFETALQPLQHHELYKVLEIVCKLNDRPDVIQEVDAAPRPISKDTLIDQIKQVVAIFAGKGNTQ